MTELNQNICVGTVITEESIEKALLEQDFAALDPDNLEIELDDDLEMDADIAEAARELEGAD